jgi:chromosome segregation ATPase
MATIEERLAALERDNVENKRKLGELDGSFQFVTGQLKNIQTYMHNEFAAVHARLEKIDGRLDGVDAKLNKIDANLEALPRALAELMREGKGEA